MSQHEQYQGAESVSAKLNSAIIYFVIYTCAAVTCQCPLQKGGLFSMHVCM